MIFPRISAVFLSLLSVITNVNSLSSSLSSLPSSQGVMTSRAARSCRNARDGGSKRLIINIVVPLLPTVRPEDIDPWPGGLKQQFNTVEKICRGILSEIVASDSPPPGSNLKCTTQIISQDDACALLIQEAESAKEDAAAIIFPGTDQLDELIRIDKMVGEDRLLLLINPQFRRAEDFGVFKRGTAKTEIFGKYRPGFSFEELSCRGEQVKLTYDSSVGWQAFAVVDEAPMYQTTSSPPLPLYSGALQKRPTYEELEDRVKEVLPDPAWKRAMKKI